MRGIQQARCSPPTDGTRGSAIIERNPTATEAPNALAKLNGYLMPLEDACLRVAAQIGYARKSKSDDRAPWEIDSSTISSSIERKE
jgi:hypothetical protein